MCRVLVVQRGWWQLAELLISKCACDCKAAGSYRKALVEWGGWLRLEVRGLRQQQLKC